MAEKVDQNLYSRQLAVYGESMNKLVTMKVYIYGLTGIGIETAKNLILSGPKQVVVQDDAICQVRDLGTNFYLSQKDVSEKKSRAAACVEELKGLNPYVKVDFHCGSVDTQFLSNFDVIVFTDFYDQTKLEEFNAYCRANKKGFINSGLLGLYGYAFVDFSDSFKVMDVNGEDTRNCILAGITQENPGVVHVHEDKRHGFEDDNTVTFKEIKGMTSLNDQKFKIKVKSPHSFSIEVDTTKLPVFQTGSGIVEQVKVPMEVSFKSFKDSIKSPVAEGKDCLDIVDFAKMGRSEQLHVYLRAILQFQSKNKSLPKILDENDYQSLLKIVNEIKGDQEIDVEHVRIISYFAQCQLTAFASFWGGIVAQEIVKFTGKFMPLRQWLHVDYFESYDSKADRKNIQQSRYYDQQIIYGNEIQKKIEKLNIFMIGAGALGCELLKLYALMGFGNVQVTDDDQIETSNLNRQFLFRKENVGTNKAQSACARVMKMNPALKTKAMQLRAEPRNENILDDDFWNSLDFVVNAVDNVKARLYIDSRCVWFKKALFESGTLGTKCNSQLILPNLTQSYGESQDPPEESIPLCTLKNFPHQIEHTIQWARDYFEGMLVDGPNQTVKFVENPKKYLLDQAQEFKGKESMLRGRLDTVKNLTIAYNKQSYGACVELALLMFVDIFHNQIAQLLYSFPLDHKTTEGQLFWSGPKRPPVAVKFDVKDTMHIQFIQSCANIYAFIFGLQQEKDTQKVTDTVAKIPIIPFQPKKASIKTDDKDTTVEKIEDDDIVIEQLTKDLSEMKISQGAKLQQNEFEKDDATNWHIEFVSAVANLRARNYNISEVSDFKVKLIAGKITPALATTTAMVCGNVAMEMYKFLQNQPLENMKNTFSNLALPLWLFSEPIPPTKAQDKDYDPILMGPVKALPKGFTIWDQIEFKGPATIQQLINFFKKDWNVDITMIVAGKTVIYNTFNDASQGLNTDILQLYEQITKTKVPEYKSYLELIVSPEQDGIDISMPSLKYKFK